MATSSPASTAVSDPTALRVVLFGMPDAGKSSLLGALVQAAHTQGRALQGRLTELPPELHELQRRVYDDRPRETLEEIVPYPVIFETAGSAPTAPPQRKRAVLYDCDGRVANELLTRNRRLSEATEGSLAEAVLAADALVLVVDAAAPDEQVDADFGEFVRFLGLLEDERGNDGEVGGLPVFLVLSKCDLLAQPGDTAARWQQRIDERKKQVADRFRDFLDDPQDATTDALPLPFGSIDLRPAATAVRRPALAGVAGQPREPFGVAELFRDCFQAAEMFRRRSEGAARRLVWTLVGLGTVLSVMLSLALGFVLIRDTTRATALASRVEAYQVREGRTAYERLSEPLMRKLGELTTFQQDTEFATLPNDLKRFVQNRAREIEDYQAYRDRLIRDRSPAEARSREELQALEDRLRGSLDLPTEYRTEWAHTDAALLREKWLDDIAALREASQRVADWYDQIRTDGEKLLLFADRGAPAPVAWSLWTERVTSLFRTADMPPFRPTDRLPASKALPGAPPLTYAPAYAFAVAEQARQQWQRVRGRIERLRDIVTALGLTGVERIELAPLRIPARFRVDQAGERVKALQGTYRGYPDWSLLELPDAVQAEIKRTARTAYDRLLEAGQATVLAKLRQLAPDQKETASRWRQIGEWLPTSVELAEWNHLAVTVGRLSDPRLDDPVRSLSAFLQRDRFALELRSLKLRLPDDVKDRLRPAGRFTVHWQPADGETRSLSFKSESSERDGIDATITTFVPEGDPSWTFRPGDAFWATLAVKDRDDRAWTLTWTLSRSQAYQIERLRRFPRVHKPDQEATAGDLATGVTVTVTPSWPTIPDLLPVVRWR